MTAPIKQTVRRAFAVEAAEGCGVTALDIAQALGMGNRRASAWLARLADDGEIVRDGRQEIIFEDRLGRPARKRLTVYVPAGEGRA